LSTVTRHLGTRSSPDLELGGLSLRPRWGLRRIALVSALVLLACALVPAVLSAFQAPVYGAQVEFLLRPRPDVSDTAVERAMLTEEVVLTSPAVLGAVADEAGIPLESLREDTTTSMVGRSNVLRLTVADGDQDRALALVRAIEERYADLHAGDPAVDPSAPDAPTITYTVLTPARPLDDPLAPRPLQALAAGTLVGIVVAAGAALILLRPRIAGRAIRR
jgi:capsular polysaccharide biosynthesis protein